MTGMETQTFKVPDEKENMRQILRSVFDALNEKGYNPINQIVGYLLTEDPTYITNYGSARSMISKIDLGNTTLGSSIRFQSFTFFVKNCRE